MAFNDQFPSGGGMSFSNYMESGGLVQRNIKGQSGGSASLNVQGLDSATIELLAMKLAESYSAMPKPQTDVKDIIKAVGNYNEIVSGADV